MVCQHRVHFGNLCPVSPILVDICTSLVSRFLSPRNNVGFLSSDIGLTNTISGERVVSGYYSYAQTYDAIPPPHLQNIWVGGDSRTGRHPRLLHELVSLELIRWMDSLTNTRYAGGSILAISGDFCSKDKGRILASFEQHVVESNSSRSMKGGRGGLKHC